MKIQLNIFEDVLYVKVEGGKRVCLLFDKR